MVFKLVQAASKKWRRQIMARHPSPAIAPGEFVVQLKQLGLNDDTIIAIFFCDHDDMLGERDIWLKRTFQEHSIKVPFIFLNPKRFTPSRVSECMSLTDLCATFADFAGRQGPATGSAAAAARALSTF